jgi:hypothetical protein
LLHFFSNKKANRTDRSAPGVSKGKESSPPLYLIDWHF